MADRPQQELEAGQGSQCAMNPEVFAAQYRMVYSRLHIVATGIIGDRTQAHDIVQEAAIIALEKSDRFIEGSSFLAWLSEIVRRCSLNYLRKIKGRKTAATDPELLAQTAIASGTSSTAWSVHGVAGVLAEDQTAFDDEMMHALLSLSAEARCCLLLRVVLSLPYAEISEIMGMPENTAMSHVHRSKRQMRNSLKKQAGMLNDTEGGS